MAYIKFNKRKIGIHNPKKVNTKKINTVLELKKNMQLLYKTI